MPYGFSANRCGSKKNHKGKVRENKGWSAGKHVEDYCVLDLETTCVFVNSAKIIEISAIKVRNNQVVDEFSSLINPECHIPEDATAVNHITDEMVINSPTLDKIIDDLLEFVGNDVIVGYNNAGFDMNLVYDAVLTLRNQYFSNDYIDVLHAVRRTLSGLPNAKLETVCKYYKLDTTDEHRALKDCYLTKECYDRLYSEFGNIAFGSGSYSSRRHNSQQVSSETKALREMLEFIKVILQDGKISMYEFDVLSYWLEAHRELAGHYPFDVAFYALDDILEDGEVTECELKELEKTLSDLVDPVKSHSCHDEDICFVEKHICLTGDFSYGPKSSVEELILAAQGIIDSGVKRATNYVVVGAHGSEAWKTGNYGSKIQKAMELIEKGFEIKIVEEAEFIPMLLSVVNR